MAKSGIRFTVNSRIYKGESIKTLEELGEKTLDTLYQYSSSATVPAICADAEISNMIIVRAASIYLQKLVARTPIDEYYSYTTKNDRLIDKETARSIEEKKNKILKRASEKRLDVNFLKRTGGAEDKIQEGLEEYRKLMKSAEDLSQKLTRSESYKDEVIKYHSPDKSIARKDWVLIINRKKFKITDLCPFDNFSEYFREDGNNDEVDMLYNAIYKSVVIGNNKVIKSFRAENANEHFEYIELGSEKYSNDGMVAIKNFPHGSVNNHPYFSKSGVQRVTDAEISDIFSDAYNFITNGKKNQIIKRWNEKFSKFSLSQREMDKINKFIMRHSQLPSDDIDWLLNECGFTF